MLALPWMSETGLAYRYFELVQFNTKDRDSWRDSPRTGRTLQQVTRRKRVEPAWLCKRSESLLKLFLITTPTALFQGSSILLV
jgi:hypothetical protein